MGDKDILFSVSDKLGIIAALVKTADLAVGNLEYFGVDGQNVAILLDIASARLQECRDLLEALDKTAQDR